MKPTRYLPSCSPLCAGGFTLIELLVAAALSSIIFALITQSVILQSNYYLEDVGRTRIQQNLRGALDILAMNIRQAGENFDGSFPAVLLNEGSSGAPDELILRRNLLSEVLVICQPAASGASQLYVSDNTSTEAACLPANIASSLSAWSSYRSAEGGGSVKVYIFDRVSDTGEFLDYSGESVSAGDDYLSVTPTANAYPAGSTSIYLIEEFKFSLNPLVDTLVLELDGGSGSLQDVAYNIIDFQVELELDDGSVLTSLSPSGSSSWKDIKAVRVLLTGRETWKRRAFTRSVTGEYFPRNVLSG